MTILDAAALLRARKLSSVELTAECLRAIERHGPRLNAFITVTAEPAQACAAALDEELASGFDRGPLHGIPVALKDVYSTKGVRTTCGSKLFADFVPEIDAAVVEKLNKAGAVLVGKTGMHELAYGITSNNPHFGAVRNPWDIDRIPGGSSGGSGAAVAAGLCFMAMGSDTGGSIRIPASYCGVVGLKPTFGRVSRYGVRPLDFSLDHMGPLARSVRDTAITLNAIAGHDLRDDSSSPELVTGFVPAEHLDLRDVRVGVPSNFYFDKLQPQVRTAVEQMVQVAGQLGAQVKEVRVPDIAAINTAGRVILLAEASALMESYLDRRSDFGADVLALLDQGRLLPATDYINAQRLRRAMRNEFQRVWNEVDCLFTPATPMPAPKIGESTVQIGADQEDVRLASTRLVRGANVLGIPALAIPCGFSDGLPLGLQILAPPFAEARLLRIGAALEDATDYHRRVPPDL